MLSVTTTPFGAMTITLTGDLSGRGGNMVVPGLILALRGKSAARKARKARRCPPPMPYTITVDITGVTCLGLNGAALLRGIYQTVNCPVHCRAGAWTNTINLVTRGVIPTL